MAERGSPGQPKRARTKTNTRARVFFDQIVFATGVQARLARCRYDLQPSQSKRSRGSVGVGTRATRHPEQSKLNRTSTGPGQRSALSASAHRSSPAVLQIPVRGDRGPGRPGEPSRRCRALTPLTGHQSSIGARVPGVPFVCEEEWCWSSDSPRCALAIEQTGALV